MRRSRPLRVLTVVALLAATYLAVTFGQVWRTSSRDQARPADAIIVLGAAQYGGEPSPVFAARLDHAAELYLRGLAPIVVVTGGRQPGDTSSEAGTADRYLQRAGVPAAALQLEVDATTTHQSLAASARFLLAEGRDDVILVSDGWHLERAAQIAGAVGLNPLPSPAPASPYSTAAALRQMARESLAVGVGRVIGWRRLDRLATDFARGAVTAR